MGTAKEIKMMETETVYAVIIAVGIFLLLITYLKWNETKKVVD